MSRLPLEGQRRLFEVPEGVTYLNSANLAPPLRRVTEAGLLALRSRTRPWEMSGSDWFTGTERLRELLGRIVNADSEGIAIVPAVSYGIATAAANLPVGRGEGIVVLDRQFPTNVYAWRDLAQRRGARIVTVHRETGSTWTESIVDAITDDTAVVAVPNCHWTDGRVVDLERVGEVARAHGAALVVDASQSVGARPLDVERVKPDFLMTVGYKWLLGPYGLAYLYVAPRWRDGSPLERSWLTRRGSDDFARLVDYVDAYRPGARRFDGGQFPQFILTPMATAALEQILAWGVERIETTLATLTSRAAHGAAELGGEGLPTRSRAGHMIGIRFPRGLPERLDERLAAARVHVGIRGDSIRVAPHLHSETADIDRLLEVLADSFRGAS